MTDNYLAIGNDELGGPVGDTAICPHCGKPHPVEYGERILPDGTKEPTDMLGFVGCNGSNYLVAIKGRLIPLPETRL